jgi:OOP family OmpA-OmpF porin
VPFALFIPNFTGEKNMIRRFPAKAMLSIAAAALLATACTTAMSTSERVTDKATSFVSPRLAPTAEFRSELAKTYRELATLETEKWFDATDAAYYNRKAKSAERGVDVQPEDPISWNVGTPELKNAYDMLQIALVPDQKKVTTPVAAGRAQAYFDCWVEQTQEKWVAPSAEYDCRAKFYEYFCKMYNNACQGQTITDKIYRVFFATNRSDLNADAINAVNSAAAAYKAGGKEVLIAGHADRVGNPQANLALSQKRSRAVAAALVNRGVPSNAIVLKSFGEGQPLVATPDNVPNQSNRRALIVVR